MNIGSKYKYIISGFFGGFILCIISMTIEDFKHNIPIQHALNEIYHFFLPFCFGIIASIFGYIYWKRKNQHLSTLNQFNANLNSLLDINKAFVSSIDLDTVLQVIIDKSTHLINLDTGAIYLHENEKLYLGATTPPLPPEFPDLLRYDLLSNHPHIQKSLTTNKAVFITDTSNEILSEAEQSVVKIRNLRSILYIPLIIENRPVGTMILGATNCLRSFTNQEINIYNTFSGQAALSIENARLYQKSIKIANELRQQNEEFLSLNEELSENNSRIQKINNDLIIAKAKAEESDRLKTAFLNNMSHEVRTPLNAITGFSNLMTNPNLTIEKLKRFSDQISMSSEKLIDIVFDVIEMSQIHSNSISIHKSDFDFIQLITEIIQGIKTKLINKEVQLVCSFDFSDKQHFINSDKTKITKIIKHLFDNALKFTAEGQIKLDIKLQPDLIEMNITDTGIGISKEMQQKIFKPFIQVETGLVRNFGGNGLGLAIVKAYTEMLNGEINLQSELNIGTSVSIKLPVLQINQQVLPTESNSLHKYSENTVLIAEDELSNFEYLVELLSKTKAKVLYAENGQKAIDLCRTEKQIDLVLMDIKMPILDGITATKLIKGFRPDLPIIAQTAYATDSEKERFLECGFDEYICKPIQKEIFLVTIDKFMNK
jgi:signal transduction histidine kinase